ncbi:uncharacterized protein LOC131165985 [Malania oleifera]|uniref:uncharacterized protein LOC131165985 n=1 Tax=Malania oleifera TaxID=397392 RepID=UPI0025AE8502|nr:uncharacterized protein LOC131165985 [Malania oleifera]
MLEEHRPITVVVTWARFKDLFFERYFPVTVRNVKMKEFISLEQGQLTIQQYAASFQELSRFAPFMVPDEVMKAWKFQRGPRKEIHRQTTIWQMQDFVTLVDKATIVEESLQEDVRVQNSKKRPAPSNSYGGAKQGNWKKKNSGGASQSTTSTSVCFTCGKPHAGQCWRAMKACLRCGKMGH